MRAFLADHWAVLALWYGFASAIDFALMGVDKWKARRDAWRIPEATLWLFALVGGALGGTLAMQVFRHKTRHWYFRFGFPLLTVLQVALLLWVALGGAHSAALFS
ncbi:DUF1294 domain-containing protein [Intestinimonas sp.]|uniref:DUF1294 domain-containing protein n=1 Tax=Intestinimonas sp. TaxID=1965293 RepID=UPI00262154BA|nr:DUF1294 domain-containing protein [Intestinimonas sp.]